MRMVDASNVGKDIWFALQNKKVMSGFGKKFVHFVTMKKKDKFFNIISIVCQSTNSFYH